MELSGGDASSHGDHARIGIVTVSDRAHQGVYGVAGAEAMVGFLHEAVRSSWDAVLETVPDERDRIEEVLIRLVDDEACSIIVTTGGTGPAPRDVTPEATEAVCDRILPGFGEQMRTISLRFVPTAILSRQLGGHRGSCLIINLPGQPKAIRETIDEIWRAVPYAVDLLGGPYLDVDPEVCDAFRPKHARRDVGGTKTP